ncbi:MAG: urease accessory protein UreE [Myxococcales bacterium]|nr:urease accessory protein UreE [Myxococcales bacterium]MCB9642374.1 urease accessory protein UreE [Myxococcales bacterium]
MLKVVGRSDHHHGAVLDQVILPYSLRQKGRFRTTTQSGKDVGIFLKRGDVLQDGDFLFTECDQVLQVVAEQEEVITAHSEDWVAFAKACYHMGNRHVPMAIGERWLRFQPDHVLQEMLERMGLTCQVHRAPFTPEQGAYHGSGGHSHGHHHHHEESTHDHHHGESEHSHHHGENEHSHRHGENEHHHQHGHSHQHGEHRH